MQTIETARRAYADHDWATAYRLLTGERDAGRLDIEDVAALAEAAWWVGDLDTCIAAREQLYEHYSGLGDTGRAALEATAVSLRLGDKGDEALASGWRARAYRLAEKDPESVAYGYLLSLEADAAFHEARAEECVAKARQAIAIGERTGERTLAAWGTHLEGLGLLKTGQVGTGWARLDESMVAVASGDLDPLWAGLMHCGMLLACELMGDLRRAWQWVQTTERWLKHLPGAVLYPGVCRIHKVRLIQLKGGWPEAEDEARRACEELLDVHVYTAARGYYEIAEIKRLRGELDAAYEFYSKAHELGFDPQPGLAQVRLAQGRIEAAAAGIRRALNSARDEPSIGHLLPHKIEIALAAGRVDEARAEAKRLDEIASTYESPGLLAAAATCNGAVALAGDDAEAALSSLRRAVDAWFQVDCPYEVARARVLAAQARRLLGDDDGASLELEAALKTFQKLGAASDVRRVTMLLGRAAAPAGLSAREVEVLRLIAAGMANKQIADDLVISEHTVARHVSNIFAKLGVASRASAASFALKNGLA